MKLKTTLIALFTSCLMGCVGGQILKERSDMMVVGDRSADINDYPMMKEIGCIKGGPLIKNSVMDSCGKPERIEKKGTLEKWFYKRHIGWSGAIAYALIVPVPLVIPTGFRGNEFDFNGNQLISVERYYTREKHGACGFVNGHNLKPLSFQRFESFSCKTGYEYNPEYVH